MTVHFTDVPAHEKVQPTRLKTLKAARKGPQIYRKYFKRAFDVTIVLATAPITVPVISVFALAVMVTGQSAFYTQQRIGRGGDTFRIWKLQTMLPNADALLEEYLSTNPAARAEWESKQKLADDPRVTPVGKWLRRSSMDELPQLLNVFNGTMSLVGPRPMMVEQKDQYPGEGYYNLHPGMTGPWQVSDRNDSDFADRVSFDDEYDRDLSLSKDLGMLFKTISVVFRGTGC